MFFSSKGISSPQLAHRSQGVGHVDDVQSREGSPPQARSGRGLPWSQHVGLRADVAQPSCHQRGLGRSPHLSETHNSHLPNKGSPPFPWGRGRGDRLVPRGPGLSGFTPDTPPAADASRPGGPSGCSSRDGAGWQVASSTRLLWCPGHIVCSATTDFDPHPEPNLLQRVSFRVCVLAVMTINISSLRNRHSPTFPPVP